MKLDSAAKGFETAKVAERLTCLWCRYSEFTTRYSLAVHTVERHKDKMTSPQSLTSSTSTVTGNKFPGPRRDPPARNQSPSTISPPRLIKSISSVTNQRDQSNEKGLSFLTQIPPNIPQKTFSTEVKDTLGVLDCWIKGNEVPEDRRHQSVDLEDKMCSQNIEKGRNHT